MTREQYEEETADNKTAIHSLVHSMNYVEVLEQRIADLELKLADAETYFVGVHTESPKNCEGCRYQQSNPHGCLHWSASQEDCCVRYPNLTDYYEPKDTE